MTSSRLDDHTVVHRDVEVIGVVVEFRALARVVQVFEHELVDAEPRAELVELVELRLVALEPHEPGPGVDDRRVRRDLGRRG